MFRLIPKQKDEVTLRISFSSALTVLAVVALGLALWRVQELILVVFTAVVFASFIDGFTDWLKLKSIPRTPAVVMIFLITLGVFGGVIYMFLPVFFNELSGLLALLPSDSVITTLLSAFSDGGLLQGNGDPTAFFEEIQILYETTSVGSFVQNTTTFLGSIVNLVLTLVIAFYLAVQDRGIEQFLRIVTPQSYEKYAIDVWRRTKRKIGLWFQGQLLLALVIGILTYLGLLLIGVPYALLLSLISGVFALIPFGAFIAIVPALLIAFSAEGWSMALLVGGLFIIIQQFENYLFQPLIIHRATGVPTIVVLLSLVFGVKLFGFLGLFLGIPAAVLILELLSDQQKIRLVKAQSRR